MKLRLVFEIALVFLSIRAQDELFVSNLDKNCLHCLCHAATGCDETLGCVKGYCGPFKISKLFWIDANKITLPEDDPERAGGVKIFLKIIAKQDIRTPFPLPLHYRHLNRNMHFMEGVFGYITREKLYLLQFLPAYEDCSLNYNCAKKIIINYIAKFGKDCNGDGLTDCEDYSLINFNGGWQCHPPLERNEAGQNWTRRFRVCKPLS